ncbi:Abi family protein [Kribbella sp. NPDC048915]|uniref:Abi family protein n=1 Tax=Kribbella sp. NPDC048915 TaxID=3155148 RepID=UPI0033DDA8C5
MVAYTKPHLTHEQQLGQLVGRGLGCSDEPAAIELLKTVGYYRLSAYIYPFRELIPDNLNVGRSAPYRTDRIRDGITFDHIESLWRFDRKLRLVCLDAIETVEIGLRSRLAYVLGLRDRLGHVRRESLDADACARPIDPSGALRYRNAFEQWLAKYETLEHGARSEDYVVHHKQKYDGPLPIWIAVEFFDFGALSRLFALLTRQDQNSIARDVGVHSGVLLAAWLRDMNYIRNLCAHHARLWNRQPTYKPRKFNPAQVGPSLGHAGQLEPRHKIYVHLAVLAYLVRALDPRQNWPLTLRTLVKKFPDIPSVSPVKDMGFPLEWSDLPLWTMRST